MSQSALIGPPSSRPMSLAEWADMPEDEPGELVDGRLEEEEAADYPHEAVVDIPGCEGLKLDLDALWRRVDELVEGEPEADERH